MAAERASLSPAAFLTALYDGCEGRVELRALPSRARAFVGLGDVEAIQVFAHDHGADNLYMGVATRADATSGALDNCRHLGALAVDVDFKATPEAEARERLRHFPLPPSAVVRTGGGLHPYWFLREPMDLRDAPACAEARQLLRRLAGAVGGDMAAAEPARVLRLPGTLNRKPEYGAPRPVRVEILEADRRYNPSDFDDVLPPEPETTTDAGPFVLPDRILAHAPGRNHTLWRYGRSLKARGWKLPRILAELERVNRERCEPPLPDDELGDVAHNVMTEADRPAFSAKQNGHHDRQVVRRPEIDTGNLGLDEMAALAWKAIDAANAPPRIFRYGGALAWLVADDAGAIGVEVMNQEHVRHHLADVAEFIRWTRGAKDKGPEKKPAFPPVALAADLVAVPRTTLPRLQRLVRMPIFTADGRRIARQAARRGVDDTAYSALSATIGSSRAARRAGYFRDLDDAWEVEPSVWAKRGWAERGVEAIGWAARKFL